MERRGLLDAPALRLRRGNAVPLVWRGFWCLMTILMPSIDDFAFGRQDAGDLAFLALVLAGEDADGVADAQAQFARVLGRLRRGPFFLGGVYMVTAPPARAR